MPPPIPGENPFLVLLGVLPEAPAIESQACEVRNILASKTSKTCSRTCSITSVAFIGSNTQIESSLSNVVASIATLAMTKCQTVHSAPCWQQQQKIQPGCP